MLWLSRLVCPALRGLRREICRKRKIGIDYAATTDYIHPFSAALHKDNFYATQFHPEKSGKTGEKILTNFLNL